MHTDTDLRSFVTGIVEWYSRNKRTLPWRDLREKNLGRKAYLILVSEIMLQQTQVSRVIILYKNFIQTYPRIEDLAEASNREVLIAWRGLGYNNRALRLRDTARKIVKSGGAFPHDMDSLQELPGVGHYTAGAIRNFAFGIPTPCIDVNIRRILHRFFIGTENPDGSMKKDDGYLLELAEKVLAVACPPPQPLPRNGGGERGLSRAGRGPGDWHSALMDFGSMVCTKNSPKWELMSSEMKSICKAYGKQIKRIKKVNKKEPGRMMAGRFVPNRIFRGKIVEVLRNTEKPLSLEQVGTSAIADWPAGHSLGDGWTMGDHKKWLAGLLDSLQRDSIIDVRRGRFALRE